jgi:colanic acid biosynthesis glycosyl transferase WcaI
VFWRPQLVWVVEPALFCAPAAVLAARLCGARAWLHVQDFEVDAAFDLGLLRGAWLRSVVLGAERWLMRRFGVVSTISQRMLARLLDKGVLAARAKLTGNWVDMAQFARAQPEGVAAFRAQLGIAADAVVALYSGNMGGKQGLDVLADTARLVPEVQFVFCGNGAGRAELLARCQGLPNVQFLDLQPLERLPDMLGMADIHLLPQRGDAADLVMPSKLTGMLASARAVVATAHPGTELASVVQTCGLVVPPENPTALAQAVRTLAADPALRTRQGQAGHAYATAHLDRDAVLSQFEADLLAL